MRGAAASARQSAGIGVRGCGRVSVGAQGGAGGGAACQRQRPPRGASGQVRHRRTQALSGIDVAHCSFTAPPHGPASRPRSCIQARARSAAGRRRGELGGGGGVQSRPRHGPLSPPADQGREFHAPPPTTAPLSALSFARPLWRFTRRIWRSDCCRAGARATSREGWWHASRPSAAQLSQPSSTVSRHFPLVAGPFASDSLLFLRHVH